MAADRYEYLDALNEAWGTAFWSQRYTDWEQVLPPRRTTTFANPTHQLDYTRFQSDTLLGFFLAEKEVLHAPLPRCAGDDELHADAELPASRLPPVGTAPGRRQRRPLRGGQPPHPRAELAFSADVTRGLAGGGPWMLMEHSTSAVNWQPVNRAKAPGQTIRDSLAHVARGADTIGFFQWRQSRAGSEKFHSALVPHAGPDSARFREVCRLGEIAQRLGEVRGSRVEARVALLWDYEAVWALGGPAMPSGRLDGSLVAETLHRLLRGRGVTVDVVHPSAALEAYAVVVVPTLYLVTDENAARVADAADAGAQVLVTFFSGIADEDDHVRLGGYPGAFRDLLGVRVEELFPLASDESATLENGGVATLWSEDLTATAAQCWTGMRRVRSRDGRR